MGSRYTKYDLENVTDYVQFECFCNNLMAMHGYAEIQPMGGHQDRGRDAIHVDKSTGKTAIFCYSVREDWKNKLNDDLVKINRHEHACHCVIFLTTSSLSSTEKDERKRTVRQKYDWEIDFYDLERIATMVDSCEGDRLRSLHRDIFLISSDISRLEQADAYVAPIAENEFASLHQLQRPPDDFVGRSSELDGIVKAVTNGGATIAGLYGMGGIGKTALALKVAEHVRSAFPDAQLYLDLKGTDKNHLSVSDAMAYVIRSFKRSIILPKNESELAGLYRSVLHDKRALLLMDNAANHEQVEPLIPPTGCVLLITSRQRFVLPGILTRNLEMLTPAEARTLLVRIAPRIGDHAARLAEVCGYLPLALVLASRALAERVDTSVLDYVHRLSHEKERLKLIDASLSLSYDLITPAIKKLWRILSVFPDSFDDEACSTIWDTPLHQTQDALSGLLKYSLVEWNERTSRYRLHDLARLYASNRITERERSQAQRKHAKFYLTVLDAAAGQYDAGGESLHRGLMLFDSEWLNIQSGNEYSRRSAEDDDMMASLCSEYCDVGVSLLNLRQHPLQRISWLETSLSAARRLYLREVEGRHLCNLGRAYRTIGQKRCDPTYFLTALEIAREQGHRYDEGQALGNLGVLYRECQQVAEAITVLEQRLSIARELHDRKGEGNALGNLGTAHVQLQVVPRDYSKALEFFREQLAIASEIGDRRMQGQALGNIGVAYRHLGNLELAILYHEQSLRIQKEIKNGRGEGGAFGDLGTDHLLLGDLHRAVECYAQSARAQRQAGYLIAEGHALWNLSMAYERLNDLEQADRYGQEALAILDEIGDSITIQIRKKLAQWNR